MIKKIEPNPIRPGEISEHLIIWFGSTLCTVSTVAAVLYHAHGTALIETSKALAAQSKRLQNASIDTECH